MKRFVYECDRCGRQIPESQGQPTCTLDVRRETDAAGSGETVFDPVDLCDPCAAWAFRLAAPEVTGNLASTILREIQKCKAERAKHGHSVPK